jgi:hypothetical protein
MYVYNYRDNLCEYIEYNKLNNDRVDEWKSIVTI